MNLVCITLGGPDRSIVVKGRTYRFEDHPSCGPALVGARGQILDNQPGERCPFWHAYGLWSKQGKRLDDAGLCVWEEPPEQKWLHMGGNHYLADTPENRAWLAEKTAALNQRLGLTPAREGETGRDGG